jgi:DNA-binding Xre family transcriptional regulator
VSEARINAAFARIRTLAGLPDGLGLHCLRHSYVTHLIEDGFDVLFVQQQVGHEHASTTSVYTSVSSDYKTRVLRAALDRGDHRCNHDRRRTGGPDVTKKMGYRWRLREVMAEHGMWKTTDLAPLLAERGIHLSAAQIYRLVAQVPERLSLPVLAALCDILGCSPIDLIEPFVDAHASNRRAVGVDLPDVVALNQVGRPRRARVDPDTR